MAILNIQGLLKDTVGKPVKLSKIRGGGSNVFESTTTLANARRNGADW